ARIGIADPTHAVGFDGALTGPDAMTRLVETVEADVVLNGVVGSLGLGPTLAALDSGARLALANKESLVAGGSLVLKRAAEGQIVPVDSEHSAIAQCLRGGTAAEVDRLILTASGGPFFGRTRAELADVTPEQAGKHPTWSMGPMITLNSATLVNKALEVIEAHLLFGVPYDRIDVTVHRQSVVHSMVTFVDGATIAKASPPSMKLPIALALGWPDRVPGASAACDFTQAHTWTFAPVDDEAFPAIAVARDAGTRGGSLTAVFNAANEVVAQAFLDGRTSFLAIVDTVARVVADGAQWQAEPRDVADVLAAEEWARRRASELVGLV
ncbi:1-deoxy-D-xylulose-5-phosphate reductoisomerase, partial [Tsukamurella tyrosinosolvens]|uniref:1-deoxy-D-xylulose-5-phosphate reductoisomerase n=1 Tax=Tsukamurella tyrosinosolvens TaxID=57704 RepID=UPI002163E38F